MQLVDLGPHLGAPPIDVRVVAPRLLSARTNVESRSEGARHRGKHTRHDNAVPRIGQVAELLGCEDAAPPDPEGARDPEPVAKALPMWTEDPMERDASETCSAGVGHKPTFSQGTVAMETVASGQYATLAIAA